MKWRAENDRKKTDQTRSYAHQMMNDMPRLRRDVQQRRYRPA
jgi:hypothetical protein